MFNFYLAAFNAAGEIDGTNRVFATERSSVVLHNGMLLSSDDYGYDPATGMVTLAVAPLTGDRIQYLSVVNGTPDKWATVIDGQVASIE